MKEHHELSEKAGRCTQGIMADKDDSGYCESKEAAPLQVGSHPPASFTEKVLIIGLVKSYHETAIHKDFGGLFDLRTMSCDGNKHTIKAACKGADYILHMRSFSSHSVKKLIEISGDKSRIINVDGSVSKAHEALVELYEKLRSKHVSPTK